ncbi:MAG: nickel-binding protein [Solirubrobacteraceae bacterium]
MSYFVERYVPGVPGPEIERALVRPGPVTEQMRSEGTVVRWRGSMVVPQDDACFCHFDAPSEAEVAEANRRPRIAFDRIVPAVAVAPSAKSDDQEAGS